MEAWLIALIACGGALLLILGLWLFLIAPRRPRKASAAFARPYAHRGLWGEGVPENSLLAFELAAKAGFGIELDVQLSSDGEVMVFHDYTLTRMCGRDVLLSTLSAAELRETPLQDSAHAIPTFREVLALVAGRVPLLIELKGESGNTALVAPVLKLLEDYGGEYCVESFNPLLLRAVKKQAPHVVRGILVTDLIKDKKKGSRLLNRALSSLWLNFLFRPDFIAWNEKYPKGLAKRACIALFGARSICYTVRTPEQYASHLAADTYPIFEGFLPEK